MNPQPTRDELDAMSVDELLHHIDQSLRLLSETFRGARFEDTSVLRLNH
jgi:hypothetical protein